MSSADPQTKGWPWGRFLVVVLLVGLDLWTKAWAFGWLDYDVAGAARDHHGHWRYAIVEPWFGIMLSCNRGAAFGNFGDVPHLLVGGRFIAIGVLGYLVWRADPRHRSSFVAMVLVLAGALGNLCDNLGLGCIEEDHPFGLVRDFIDVWFLSEAWGWDWHFPTFNIADSCISVGAVLWVLSGFFHRDASGEDEDDATGTPEPEPSESV